MEAAAIQCLCDEAIGMHLQKTRSCSDNRVMARLFCKNRKRSRARATAKRFVPFQKRRVNIAGFVFALRIGRFEKANQAS